MKSIQKNKSIAWGLFSLALLVFASTLFTFGCGVQKEKGAEVKKETGASSVTLAVEGFD